MDAESVLARIVENPRLPTPPTMTMRILDRASRPDCTLPEIAAILGQDPALCGKVLRLVNSSLFGLHRPVTSIDRALNLLGINHVRSLVMSVSLPSLRFPHASTDQMKSYWQSSVTMAIVCRELAHLRKWPDPDSEMVAGLLCDMGILLLLGTFPELYAQVCDVPAATLSATRSERERKLIGVDHAEAGAYCLKRWKLSEETTLAIRHHHAPQECPANSERAHLLYFASQVARLYDGADQPGLLAELTSLAHRRYEMSDTQLFCFLEVLDGKIKEFAKVLDVKYEASDSIANLFTKATENLTRLAVEASLESVRKSEEKHQAEQGLKQAKEALQRTEEQLRHAQKMEAVGRLAGGVAHDFNNLLTVILGNCEMLLGMRTLDAPVRDLIESIAHTGQRAAELTRQLLAFSRKQVLIPEVLDLNAAVADMSKMLPRLIGVDIALVGTRASNLHLVKADPSQIEQVILNLVVNARDAMPEGGTLTIETFNADVDPAAGRSIGNLPAGKYAVLAVRDTGCGMSDEVKAHLFEPFFTTKEHGKGTGLGLATVHGIIQQSRGHITVASQVGVGTAFHVYLPAAEERITGARPATHHRHLVGGNETILLAEDRDDVRAFTRRALESFGYRILEASNGVQAIQLAERSRDPIHLLITDSVMPQMGGGELIRRLTAARADLKVLFISGNAEERPMRDGMAASPLAYLPKPYTSRTLLTKVREVLDNASVTTNPT